MQQVEPTLDVPAVLTPAVEQRVILHGISWETYERLLAENDPGTGKRFTYDEGALEIVVLSTRHERPNRVLAAIADAAAEALDFTLDNVGSMTFKRKDLLKGFEPDSSFYIQNATLSRQKDQIDLAADPPPDLVIEVDISSPSLRKFPIFAAVGISEVWRYQTSGVQIYVLREGAYTKTQCSSVLPPLTGEQISFFLESNRTLRHAAWRQSIREWVQANR